MRFFAKGPAIPNDLLELSDQGEVVFFCGAGVSKPAGLPGFFELTKALMSQLKVASDSKVAKLMRPALDADDPELSPPLDQIFGLLQRDYTSDRVQELVVDALKTPRRASTTAHETILRISRDASRRAFVVTTNFDLLFEKAAPRVPRWSAPMLPRIGDDYSPTGIVYLHGRLRAAKDDVRSSLVLSSGDFGRAYLADGWATAFMQQLLARRVVVLLGYSASDPPIRYLLEGLNARASNKLRRIYAFDRGLPSDVAAKWRDLGVVGIAFPEFDDLWTSLAAWATRADDPTAWSDKVLAIATKNPRELEPFERGEVAALVSNPSGAKAFSTAHRVPPAEWLAVFDKNMRTAIPGQDGWGTDAKEVNPHELFGLDDDIPPQRTTSGYVRAEGVDLLTASTSEGPPNDVRLSGNGTSPLPPRLASLANWLERIAEKPAAIWWAAKQAKLHPHLTWLLNLRLSSQSDPFAKEAAQIWSLLLEAQEDSLEDVRDHRWFQLQNRVRLRGWSLTNLRLLRIASKPRLKVDGLGMPRVPPAHDWIGTVDTLVRFAIECPQRPPGLEIPDAAVQHVLREVTENLRECISLLRDTRGEPYFRLPAISPDSRRGERYVAQDSVDALFLWAVELYGRLETLFPAEARQELQSWPLPDPFFFDKMRIFAWRNAALFTGSEVAVGILALPNTTFWNSYLQRELLHLMKDRWDDLPRTARRKIESRILKGRDRFPRESETDFVERKDYQVAARLGWLELNQCALNTQSKRALRKTRSNATWITSWENNADHDMDGRAGWVERRKDPAVLAEAPLNTIVEVAQRNSGRTADFVESDPFAGLVEQRPMRALAALSLEARFGRYPIKLWEDLLDDWPETATARQVRVCGLRLTLLPTDQISQLRYSAPRWLEKNLEKIFDQYPTDFWKIWDAVYAALAEQGKDATRSALGDATANGQPTERSRATTMHAINAPIGNLVETLFKPWKDKNEIKPRQHLPAALAKRLEQALSAPGEGALHAATLIGQRLVWLFYVDAGWTKRFLVPCFSIGSQLAEAAWNGLLFNATIPRPAKLFTLVKPDFLLLFSSKPDWLASSEAGRQAGQMLIIANYWHAKNRAYVDDFECTAALRAASDEVRQSALWMVGRILQTEARAGLKYGKKFFGSIWPQEAKYQTSGSTQTMIHLATENPDNFGVVVAAIRSFLRPIEHPDTFVFSVHRWAGQEGRRSIAEQWPMEVLQVLDGIISSETARTPYDLARLLDEIAERAPIARNTQAWMRLRDLTSR